MDFLQKKSPLLIYSSSRGVYNQYFGDRGGPKNGLDFSLPQSFTTHQSAKRKVVILGFEKEMDFIGGMSAKDLRCSLEELLIEARYIRRRLGKQARTCRTIISLI